MRIAITREKGLKPLKDYVFDVRPVSSSGAVGKWSSLTRFVGTFCYINLIIDADIRIANSPLIMSQRLAVSTALLWKESVGETQWHHI